jgi:WD40 repeat protein
LSNCVEIWIIQRLKILFEQFVGYPKVIVSVIFLYYGPFFYKSDVCLKGANIDEIIELSNNRIVTGSTVKGEICIWNLNNGSKLTEHIHIAKKKNHSNKLCLINNNTIAYRYADIDTITIWDFENNNSSNIRCKTHDYNKIVCVKNNTIAFITENANLQSFNIRTFNTRIDTYASKYHTPISYNVYSMLVVGNKFLVGYYNKMQQVHKIDIMPVDDFISKNYLSIVKKELIIPTSGFLLNMISIGNNNIISFCEYKNNSISDDIKVYNIETLKCVNIIKNSKQLSSIICLKNDYIAGLVDRKIVIYHALTSTCIKKISLKDGFKLMGKCGDDQIAAIDYKSNIHSYNYFFV